MVFLVHKVRAWPRFQASLAAYQLIPSALVSATAGLLVIAEAVVSVGLLLCQAWSTLLAQALLGLYALVIAISVLRGRTHIDCGCGDEPTPVSWLLVVRNGLLISIAVIAWRLMAEPGGIAVFAWLNVILALGLSGLALLMYQAIEQLLANRGRYKRLWHGVS